MVERPAADVVELRLVDDVEVVEAPATLPGDGGEVAALVLAVAS